MHRHTLNIIARVSWILLLLGALITPATVAQAENGKPDDWNISREIMCNIITYKGLMPALYQLANSDDLPYWLKSKSVAVYYQSNVDNVLNQAVDWVNGTDKAQINSDISGYDIGGAHSKYQGKYNATPGVYTAFDRFGFSGLSFTKYLGEWRYVQVDACKESRNDQHVNAWYDGRQEPLETWSSAGVNSSDPRTRLVGTGIGDVLTLGQLGFGELNWLIIKLFAFLIIMLLAFAFSDISYLLGLQATVFGDGQQVGGIFASLMQNLFFPLSSLFLIITGLWALYAYLVKRKGRAVFNQVAFTLFALLIGAGFAYAPTAIVELPNTVSVIGQSAITSAFMGGSFGGDEGLCQVPTGDLNFKMTDWSAAGAKQFTDNLGNVMKRSLECGVWHNLVFEPWVESQFGTSYRNLYAGDNPPSNGNLLPLGEKTKTVVGDAPVPLGGGTEIHNWALLQLSSLTDGHAAADRSGHRPTRNGSVAGDFYRVADALFNVYYEEETSTIANNYDQEDKKEVTFQKVNPDYHPSEYVDTWTGSPNWIFFNSIFALVLDLFTGGILLVFAARAAVYSIAITLLMIFCPIFLALAILPLEKTKDFCRGYTELLVNTAIKRCLVGAAMVIALLLTDKVFTAFHQVGLWYGLSLAILVTVFTFKFWGIIKDRVASVKFSSSGELLQQAASNVSNKFKRIGATAGAVAVGAGVAHHQAKKQGLGGIRGTITGLQGMGREHLRQKLYTSELGRPIIQEYEKVKQEQDNTVDRYCNLCGKLITGAYFSDPDNEMLCPSCYHLDKDENIDKGFLYHAPYRKREATTNTGQSGPYEQWRKDILKQLQTNGTLDQATLAEFTAADRADWEAAKSQKDYPSMANKLLELREEDFNGDDNSLTSDIIKALQEHEKKHTQSEHEKEDTR